MNSTQSKQHIVIHRPIGSVGATAPPPGQKHILLRKSNASTAQIVPLNTSQSNSSHAQPGKHTFAYLGTIIKPNKPRDSVVFPPGDERSEFERTNTYFVNDSDAEKLVRALNGCNHIRKRVQKRSKPRLHAPHAMSSDDRIYSHGA